LPPLNDDCRLKNDELWMSLRSTDLIQTE